VYAALVVVKRRTTQWGAIAGVYAALVVVKRRTTQWGAILGA
jgi:hypothetical protein